MRVGIFSGTAAEQDIESLLNKVREVPEMSGASFSETVSTKQTYVVPAVGTKKFQVAALDLGIKSMTPHLMAQRGIEVHVVPATISAEDLLAAGPDGIFVCKQLLMPSAHSLESVLAIKSWDAPLGLVLTNFVTVIAESISPLWIALRTKLK
jgi:carbamoyl-phosphate synthase small subunit